MPETRVLIIESDRPDAEQAAIKIRLKYPDAVVTIAQDMNSAMHALEPGNFDLILYNPMSLFSLGSVRRKDGTIKSPVAEIADYLSEYGSKTETEVIAVTPNNPPMDVRYAIANANIEAITQKDFQQVLNTLQEIAKRKSGGGTAHRVEVANERLQAKIEVALAQVQELKTEVKSILTVNWQQEQSFIEIRNQLQAIAANITDLEQGQSELRGKVDGLSNAANDRDHQSKLEIARMDANSKRQTAIVAAIATAIVGFLTFLGTPTVRDFIERVIPPRHQEPPPKPTKTPLKKNG